jgi:glutamate-1-semialdehyde 2,1-aminomutase
VWSGAWSGEALRQQAAPVALQWFVWTGVVVAGRVAYLLWAHGPRLALVWFVKLATDPLTDVIAYSPRFLARLSGGRAQGLRKRIAPM